MQDMNEKDEKRERGQVKWFNPDVEYGYITPDEGTLDLFFRYTASEDEKMPAEGDQVEYKKIHGRDGPEATELTIV